MKQKIKIIELFSGIGGFSKGLEQAGFEIEKHYFSEIDKHAIANYKYNYQNAEYIGSVVDFRPRDFRDIDIITFGSPCQDFSLAGKRKGLEGERSSLIEYAIRAISDIRPSVFIWENVKGAFSSNSGADFWAILQAFANIGNYRLEWQLLNTKWFLPQNRERIYLIGHLADRSEPGVFPITEEIRVCNERYSKKPNQIASTLNANDEKSWVGNFIQVKTLQGSDTLNTIRSGGRGSLTDKHSWDIVQLNISLESGGKQPYQQNRIYDEKGISPCLMKEKSDLLIGTWRTHKDGNGFREIKENISPTIPARAREDGSGQPVINENAQIRRLTEIECERLQGFPDNWTEYGNYDGVIKKTPKTQRYKMLGNAVTVKVVEEIAKRLKIN